MAKKKRRVGSASKEDEMRESELGLSLGLHTKNSNDDLEQEDNDRELLIEEERREIKNKENSIIMSNFNSIQNKPQRPELQAMAPPQNRKARVSVRARCESATVSFFFLVNTTSYILTSSFKIYVLCYLNYTHVSILC